MVLSESVRMHEYFLYQLGCLIRLPVLQTTSRIYVCLEGIRFLDYRTLNPNSMFEKCSDTSITCFVLIYIYTYILVSWQLGRLDAFVGPMFVM